MRKYRLVLILFLLSVTAAMMQNISVKAGNLEILDILQVEERVEAREKPVESAEIGKVYEAGEYLLVVEGGNEQWYAVAFQGKVYYVKKGESVVESAAVQIQNSEDETMQEILMDDLKNQLDIEMEIDSQESKAFIEAYERYQKEMVQKRIWGVIIVILMAAIFGVSIVSRLLTKREETCKIVEKTKKRTY